MPVVSTGARNSEQKRQNSIPSAQISISETVFLPNSFNFWNGDEYIGQFAVIKEKQKITMQGWGVYKTSDDEAYEGLWENDCLKDKCKITFPGKVVFSGHLDEMKIQGLGKYIFKGKVEVEGIFVNNRLTGEVHLKDPNHQTWKGRVDVRDVCVNFYPLHPFWQSVLNLPSKPVQVFYGEADEEIDSVGEGIY